jgi:hypothetical protein
MVDKTGRSVKKKANKFKGVDANRMMEDTGRLVHMKLQIGIRRFKQKCDNANLEGGRAYCGSNA